MTMRTWMTPALLAAMLAASACKNTDGKASDGKPAAAEGRRGTTMPRDRAMDSSRPAGSTGRMGTSTGAGSPSGETTSGVSSGDNAAKAPATGTTPGGAGNTGANGTSTDGSTSGK